MNHDFAYIPVLLSARSWNLWAERASAAGASEASSERQNFSLRLGPSVRRGKVATVLGHFLPLRWQGENVTIILNLTRYKICVTRSNLAPLSLSLFNAFVI